MTEMKLVASHIGGRLLKSVATSALALSAVAGGVMLSGGEVKAVTLCFDFPPGAPPPPSCTDGGWTVVHTAFNAPGQTGIVDLTDLAVSPDQAQVDIDFDPPTSAGQNGSYFYTISTAGQNIIRARLSAVSGGVTADYEAFKYIYRDSSKATLIDVLNITESSGDDLSVFFSAPSVYVEDYWSSSASGQVDVDAITNSYQTPGPLPILGAGAAFGFSRKLRSRIKASRSA